MLLSIALVASGYCTNLFFNDYLIRVFAAESNEMESLSSEKKALALDILYDIQSAIERIQGRTKDIRSADDFLSSPEGMTLLDATCMLLIVVGESLKNLDKVTDGKLLPTYHDVLPHI